MAFQKSYASPHIFVCAYVWVNTVIAWKEIANQKMILWCAQKHVMFNDEFSEGAIQTLLYSHVLKGPCSIKVNGRMDLPFEITMQP